MNKRLAYVLAIPMTLTAGWFLFDKVATCVACRNNIEETSWSPDHKLKAVLFHRDCGGATSVGAASVSVVSASQALPNENANCFAAWVPDGGRALLNVELKWSGPRALLIKYDRRAKTWTKGTDIDVWDAPFGIEKIQVNPKGVPAEDLVHGPVRE